MGDLLARGRKVGLRRLTEADATEEYVRWLQDPEVNAYLENRFGEHTVESVADFILGQAARGDTLFLAIVEVDGGTHVGNIKIGPLHPHHGTADVGLLIGAKERWGRGYASEAIALAADLGFSELGARKLTASCYSGNRGSMAAFLNAGWREEGARPGQFLDDQGGEHDQVMFGLTKGG